MHCCIHFRCSKKCVSPMLLQLEEEEEECENCLFKDTHPYIRKSTYHFLCTRLHNPLRLRIHLHISVDKKERAKWWETSGIVMNGNGKWIKFSDENEEILDKGINVIHRISLSRFPENTALHHQFPLEEICISRFPIAIWRFTSQHNYVWDCIQWTTAGKLRLIDFAPKSRD